MHASASSSSSARLAERDGGVRIRFGARRPLLALSALLVLAAAPGCSLLRPYAVTPGGLARDEARARSLLGTGRADTLARLLRDREIDPGDELLRLLYGGVASHNAGDYAAAAELFERAAVLTDERETRSAGRGALSIVTSDRVLPYVPTSTERLLIPYYAALGYLRRGDATGATVEARRLSRAIEREQDPPGEIEARRLRGVLSYLAATVFEAGAEWNDAAVAYRRAAALTPALVQPDDTAFQTGDGRQGVVLVLVETGYAPPRVEQSLYAWIDGAELRGLTEGDDEGRAGVATLIATRLAAGDREPPRRPATPRKRSQSEPGRATACGRPPQAAPPDSSAGAAARPDCAGDAKEDDEDEEDDDTTPYLLKLAWPVLQPVSAPVAPARVVAGETEAIATDASLGAGLARDFEAQRTWILARAVIRAAAKLALARAAEKEVGEKDGTAGKIVGMLANAGGVLLEHADTRAWSLLPNGLSIARLRLSPGEHAIRISTDAGTVERLVIVDAGRTTFLDVRIW